MAPTPATGRRMAWAVLFVLERPCVSRERRDRHRCRPPTLVTDVEDASLAVEAGRRGARGPGSHGRTDGDCGWRAGGVPRPVPSRQVSWSRSCVWGLGQSQGAHRLKGGRPPGAPSAGTVVRAHVASRRSLFLGRGGLYGKTGSWTDISEGMWVRWQKPRRALGEARLGGRPRVCRQ